jgi:hypothetical protein
MENEEWRDIKTYEGIYQVSNKGRIRSLDRYGKRTENTIRKLKGRILKPFPVQAGYLSVYLCNEYGKKSFKVHRLVATAFLSNPKQKNEVNHKDGNRQNNEADNLEWVTKSENQLHSFRVLHRTPIMLGKFNEMCPNSKPVNQYSKNGELIKTWPSTMEVERTHGWSASNIAGCCRGEHFSAYGYKWKYL